MSYDPLRFTKLAASADRVRPRFRVEDTAIIDAPIDRVWAIVRDFGTGERWLPTVARCEIENGEAATAIGAVRRLTLDDGRQTREQLVGLSDKSWTQELTIVESAMPARDYVATFRLAPVSDGNRCWISWSAEFESDANQAATLMDTLRHKIFRVGFERLRAAATSPAGSP